MSGCIGFAAAKAKVIEVIEHYHPNDYKVFVAGRSPEELYTAKVTLGVVVRPDVDKNTTMFEDFISLQSLSDACIRVLDSKVNFEESKNRLVDLFLLEIAYSIEMDQTPRM